MAALFNRVWFNTATTTNGDITPGAAVSAAYRTPSSASIPDNLSFSYLIEDGNAWEIGRGHMLAGVMVRSVIESTNSNLALVLSGNAKVQITAIAQDSLQDDVSSNLTAGFTTTSFDAGTKSSGTFTPNPANGNFQHYLNNGAHILAAPTLPCSMVLKVTNDSAAGMITLSGFGLVTGDEINTVDDDVYLLYVTKSDALAHLHVVYIATDSLGDVPIEPLGINGACEVSQIVGTTAVVLATGTEVWTIDLWSAKFVRAATLAISAQQVTPSGSPPSGFKRALQLKATTGLGSLAVGDYGFSCHFIEGTSFGRLAFGTAAAKSITIGFWVYATIAGTFAVSITNSAKNRSYVKNVVINAAATWEWKTVTFPGDMSGTWLSDIGIGLRVRFCFGSGSTNQGTADTWAASDKIATSSTTNFFASTNNVCEVMGVIELPGKTMPINARSPVAHSSFGKMHLECQRHFQKSYAYNVAIGTATNSDGVVWVYLGTDSIVNGLIYGSIQLKRSLRTAPTATFYGYAGGAGKVANSSGVDLAANSGGTVWAGENAITPWNISGGTVTTSGFGILFHWVADARWTL